MVVCAIAGDTRGQILAPLAAELVECSRCRAELVLLVRAGGAGVLNSLVSLCDRSVLFRGPSNILGCV